jgi:integrase
MNVFELDQALVNDYERFARSFTQIRAIDIRSQVEALYASFRNRGQGAYGSSGAGPPPPRPHCAQNHWPSARFVNADGSPKSHSTVAWLIKTYARRRAGIVLTSHQFRHLSAKVLLDAEPGSFETVRQLLGHKSLKTTVGAYAGIDSRRAAIAI